MRELTISEQEAINGGGWNWWEQFLKDMLSDAGDISGILSCAGFVALHMK